VLAKDGFPKLEGVTTLYEMFESSVRRFGDCDCLGWREAEGSGFGPYKWWTYREVHGRLLELGSAHASVMTMALSDSEEPFRGVVNPRLAPHPTMSSGLQRVHASLP